VDLVSWWDCGNAADDSWVWVLVLVLPLDEVGRSDVRKVEESTVDGFC
jgi:hypothetical protein